MIMIMIMIADIRSRSMFLWISRFK